CRRAPNAVELPGLTSLRASLPLGSPGDEALVLRIQPQPCGFEYRHTQQWFFFFAGEDESATGRPSENFDHSEADRQFLLGTIGELIGTPARRAYAQFAQHASWKEGIGCPGIHERPAFPGLARICKRSNRDLRINVSQIRLPNRHGPKIRQPTSLSS